MPFFAMDNMAYEQVMNPAAEADKIQYSNFVDAKHGAITDYWKTATQYKQGQFCVNNEEAI
jgi:hypothetical protein